MRAHGIQHFFTSSEQSYNEKLKTIGLEWSGYYFTKREDKNLNIDEAETL